MEQSETLTIKKHEFLVLFFKTVEKIVFVVVQSSPILGKGICRRQTKQVIPESVKLQMAQ